jgi:hypothetical protein
MGAAREAGPSLLTIELADVGEQAVLRGIHVRRLLRDELTKDQDVLGHSVLLSAHSDSHAEQFFVEKRIGRDTISIVTCAGATSTTAW